MNSSYEKIRSLIISGVSQLIKLPDSIFQNATVETMIFIANKTMLKSTIKGAFYKNNEKIEFYNLLFNDFKRDSWQNSDGVKFNIFTSPHIISVLNKMVKGSKNKLIDSFDFTLGITPYDKYKGHSKELIENKEFHSPIKKDDTYVPLISGSNIKRFYIDEKNEEFLKYGDWLGAPRQQKFFKEPKVIVRQIISGNPPRIYAGYTKKELYFTQIGFSIIKKKDAICSLKFLTSILNSSTINFYHKYNFLDIEKNTFQKILIENCKMLPLPSNLKLSDDVIISTLHDYVNTLLNTSLKQLNDFVPNTHIAETFEEVIDAMVMELYFKEDFEREGIEFIKYAERDFKSIEGLAESEQIKVIHEAYQKLREKENEIRNNLKLMDTRLNEIVMPIKTV